MAGSPERDGSCVAGDVRWAAYAGPIITTVAGGGPDDVPAYAANLITPSSLAFDGSGNLYVLAGSRVFRITPNGRLLLHAGTGVGDFSGDGGPAKQAALSALALAADDAGNVIIADSYNNRIRRVDAATGLITTIAGTGAAGFGGDGGPATSATLGFLPRRHRSHRQRLFLCRQSGAPHRREHRGRHHRGRHWTVRLQRGRRAGNRG